MAVVVGDLLGNVMWTGVACMDAWMQAASASTTLFEMMALHEGSAAVHKGNGRW